jgi:hypothetical protein
LENSAVVPMPTPDSFSFRDWYSANTMHLLHSFGKGARILARIGSHVPHAAGNRQ